VTDTVLSTGNYGSDNGTVTFNFSTVVGASSTADLWVVYSFSSTGAGNYQAGLASNTALTGTGAGQGLVFTGAPITSSAMTVMTATPTTTSTATVTPTQTFLPGATPVVIVNPVLSGTAQVLPQAYGGSSDITVSIYTSAFKLVAVKGFPAIPAGQALGVDLVDDWGEPLADGLYYLAVATKKDRKTVTMILLR